MQLHSTARPGGFLKDFDVVNEIQENAFRALVIAASLMLLAWYLLVSLGVLEGDVISVSLVVLTAGAGCGLAIQLIRHSFGAAQLVWITGLVLANGLAIRAFALPEAVYFFCLIPLLTVAITFRWQWGLLAEAGLGVLLLLSEPLRLGLPVFSSPDGSMVLLLGLVTLVIGFVFSQAMLSIAGWSISHYRGARTELESIRVERARLLEVQEDFSRVNNELARITDRLAAMTQVAEEARRVKEDFVARVSHELRTPLNMIIGFSEVIMQSPQLYGEGIPSALLADVDAILRNSQHLSRLVDDILDLSQVEAGRMALTKEWTSLPEVIDEAVSAVKGLFDTKGLYLRQSYAVQPPPIFCDSTRIRQVIINLLGNAARFTEHGGVEIKTERKEGMLIVSVQDSGPGIAFSHQQRVFEPFQQVDSVLRRHKGGTGLGLTISKQFVEMHGGTMWLESEVGAGTTFFFTLPVQVEYPALDEEAAKRWFSPYLEYTPRSHPANLPAPRIKPRYVLVEGEDTLQRLFTRYADDVEVLGVRKVEEGVHEVRRSPAQALIINSPERLDEPALQSRLNGLPFGTPVISCWMPGKEEAARRLGVIDYLVKPVTRLDVLAALQKAPGAKRVLLVDDEPEILRLFVRMLSSIDQPLSLIQAMNGRRALQLLRARKPDLMLLDLVMPEMDGFQVLQEKSQDPHIRGIPVVVISSQNPRGESNVSKTFSVARGEGLSAYELLTCIQSITGILVPEERTPDPTPAGTTAEIPAS